MVTTETEFRRLDRAENLPDAYVNPYYLEDLKHRVSVARVGGSLYAFDDLCPCVEDLRCALSAGLLEGTTIMCQCHGSQFDLVNGTVLRGPATTPLRAHEVRETDVEIQVRI